MKTWERNLPGCSTCQPGYEKYAPFAVRGSRVGAVLIQYEYRTPEGELFACCAVSLDTCRAKRDAWLAKKGGA